MVLADPLLQTDRGVQTDAIMHTAAGRHSVRRGKRRSSDRLIRFIAKPIVFFCCLLPLAWLAWAAATGGLGVNPIEAVNRFLGDWALRFLLISLAVSPLREITGIAALIRFRRMLGLFAFTYVALHLSSWIGLDQFFSWPHIWKDIVKRPFITIGMAAFLLLTPLAATSTTRMIKRLGAKRWRRLHMLVYPAGALGCLHYFMMVKADIREPLIYAAILALLLGWRAATRWRPALSRPSAASPSSPSSRG
ncbi:MAG: protein-methionine-sulfoxide reductase heme-binding subunit MsrQ [Rhodospirillales bacterium]